MRDRQEIATEVALRWRPAVFCVQHGCDRDRFMEVIADALNAVRLGGCSQILFSGGLVHEEWNDDDNSSLARICKMITAMQTQDEKIEITTTPDKPEERAKAGFCRIDLRLKK